MEPLLFKPVIKQIRWGGRKLGTVLNKPIGDDQDYAESWEITDQADGQSVVAAGTFSGANLSELIRDHSAELLGRHQHLTQFPLLIKFLDAHDWLSLQVHPNDQQAVTYNPAERGKTEAWIILDAEPDSQLCAGLKEGVTKENFEHHLNAGTIEETLNLIPAKVGDCVFVPAQTVHALGPGILLAEVQQQSNLTFRLYDWGRMGSDGLPRQIHVEESLACTDFERGPVSPVTPVELSYGTHHFEELVRCDYFVIRRHKAVNEFSLKLDDRFRILMVLEGAAQLLTKSSTAESNTLEINKGTTILLPASTAAASLIPTSNITVLEILTP